MANDVVVVIYDPVITAMSDPGGMVWKWAYQRRKRIERLAISLAPKDTGHMASKITGSYEKVPNGVVMYVASPVWYSIYPHEGTQAYKSAKKMRIPGTILFPRPTYTYYRRGQRAKPFLTEAMNIVLRDL